MLIPSVLNWLPRRFTLSVTEVPRLLKAAVPEPDALLSISLKVPSDDLKNISYAAAFVLIFSD